MATVTETPPAVTDFSNFDKYMAQMKAMYLRDGADTVIFCDTESNGEDVRDGRGYLTGISFSVYLFSNESSDEYFPVRHPDVENNLPPDKFKQLKDFIENYTGWLVFHNTKFDLENLRTAGIIYTGKFYDTMLMVHGINENLPVNKSLESCVKHYVGPHEGKETNPGFKFLIKHYGWGGMPSNLMRGYAMGDTRVLGLLWRKIFKMFQREVPEKYWEHKQAFMRVIIAMERRGIIIDQEFSKLMVKAGEEEMERIVKKLNLNPGSPKDLKVLLLDKLGLPVVKLTAKGLKLQKEGVEVNPYDYPSFDKEAMEEYDEILARSDDDTAKEIFAYRGWQKTVSSNYRAYLELVSPDGRLRPNYKLHGTKTGRLSCEKPNLQQIPRQSDKPWNGKLKQAFVPAAGYELWEFDYSQLEFRLGTAYALQFKLPGELELAQVFIEGRDIFDEMAAQMEWPRQDTKGFVYSTQYGAGLERISRVFGISKEEAAEKKNAYYQKYQGFAKLMKMSQVRCKATGKIQIWSGRHRHFWDKDKDAHKAFNSAIQGGAADIVEHVMVRLFQEVDDSDRCRMLLQVHDSVVFEIREDLVETYVPAIKAIMADVQPDFGVVFAVDAKKWGSK